MAVAEPSSLSALRAGRFVDGQRIVEVCADLDTTIGVRRRPVGEVETFARADDVEGEDAPMATEDLGHVLVRFDGGARGAFKVSQGAAGRKNLLGDAIARSNAERRRVEVPA